MPVQNFTYNADPANDPRDAVRALVGDTQADSPLLDDNELDFYLSESSGNVYLAAAQACEAAAALLSRVSGNTMDGVTYGDSATYYQNRAAALRLQAARRGGGVYAGGISKADKQQQEEDQDRVDPSFTRDIFAPRGGLFGSVSNNQRSDE